MENVIDKEVDLEMSTNNPSEPDTLDSPPPTLLTGSVVLLKKITPNLLQNVKLIKMVHVETAIDNDVSWLYQLAKILLHLDKHSNWSYRPTHDALKYKFNKYWKKVPLSLALASIMDPRYKNYALKLYKPSKVSGSQKTSKIYKTKLTEMYETYRQKMYGTVSGLGEGTSKTELQQYLDQPLYEVKNGEDLNILDWWKAEERTYPIMSAIARDLLTKSVNVDPLESDFNEIFASTFRFPMKLNSVQTLLYFRNWVVDANELQPEDPYDIEQMVEGQDVVMQVSFLFF